MPHEPMIPEGANNEPLFGCKILVVEDQMVLLRMMEGMLRDLGCTQISAAATLPEALTMARSGDFDAVALDVNLNGTMSFRVADVLAGRQMPFMFVTGYGESGIPAAYQDRPVLRKPFLFSQAMAAFSALLPAKRSMAATS